VIAAIRTPVNNPMQQTALTPPALFQPPQRTF
jgi:hypothetical protein